MVEVLFAVTFLKKRGQYMNANTIDASKKGQAKPVPPGGQDKFEIATHDGNPSNEPPRGRAPKYHLMQGCLQTVRAASFRFVDTFFLGCGHSF